MVLEEVESALLRECIIKVKGKEIDSTHIMDSEITWDLHSFMNYGYITFRDALNHVENAPIIVGDELDMYFKDFDKKIYKQKFKVQKISKIKVKSGAKEFYAKIEFIDKNSFEFMKVYESKAYKSKPVQDFIKEYFNKYKQDDKSLTDETTPLYFGNNGDESFIIPSDRSFFKTLNKMITDVDMLFFNKRKEVMMTFYDKLTSKGPRGPAFKPDPKNEHYIHKIADYDIKNYDGFTSNITNGKIEIYSIDYKAGKKIIKTPYDFSTAEGEIGKLGGTTIPITEDKDPKVLFSTYNSKAVQSIAKKYASKAVEIVMTVPGTFENEVGDVIEVEFPTGNIKEDIEKNISGKYLITKVVDKIISGYFVQQLTVSRTCNK